MAKNFASAGSASTFDTVKKINTEKAKVVTLKMVSTDNLVDYPNNGEDVDNTIDLEHSIQELGFTDPIEVTDFGQPEGKYMIVSGHRRRQAGVKCGIDTFPCLVRHFENEDAVANYVLMSNSQRDSGKDPLLYCKRYRMHAEYVINQGFTRNFRDIVAKRLGVSKAQASRYDAMNRVISSVWDMVRDDIVGMSSVVPMATFNSNEQGEIYNIMVEAVKSGMEHISRDTMGKIISSYRNGKKSWKEIVDLPRDSGLPLNHDDILDDLNGANSSQSGYQGDYSNNDSDYNESTDYPDSDYNDSMEDKEDDESLDDIGDIIDNMSDSENSSNSEEIKRGETIFNTLKKLGSSICFNYSFADSTTAEEAIRLMSGTFQQIVDEMYEISKDYNLKEEFQTLLSDMKERVDSY